MLLNVTAECDKATQPVDKRLGWTRLPQQEFPCCELPPLTPPVDFIVQEMIHEKRK